MSEIKPALTAEQWADALERSRLNPSRPIDREVAIRWREHQDAPYTGLAALLLYGQPLGFTQEDVRLLEEWRSGLMTANYGRGRGSPVERQLASLADRIKALLRPEAP